MITRVNALEYVLDEIRTSVTEGDFPAARKLNDRAITLFLDSLFEQDREELETIRDRFAAFASEVGSEAIRDLPDRAVLEAQLRANAVFANLAARRRPTGVRIPLDAQEGVARDKVLRILRDKAGASTSELAQQVGVRQETMSRILTALKAEGLVASRRAGRRVVSRLTPRGRTAAGTTKPEITSNLAIDVVRDLSSTVVQQRVGNLAQDLVDGSSDDWAILIRPERDATADGLAQDPGIEAAPVDWFSNQLPSYANENPEKKRKLA